MTQRRSDAEEAQRIACISFGIALRISASQRLCVKMGNSQTGSESFLLRLEALRVMGAGNGRRGGAEPNKNLARGMGEVNNPMREGGLR